MISSKLVVKEANDKIIHFSEAIEHIITPIGGIVEELADEDRNKDAVEEKVNLLSAGLKDALVETKKSEDELAIIIETYKTSLKEACSEQATNQKLLTDSRSESNELRAESTKIDSKLRELETNISSLEREIEVARKEKKKEEEKRKNAAMDLIPFYGLVDGIIQGKPERAIPGYSQIDGLISAIGQKVENLQRRIDSRHTEKRTLQNEKLQNTRKMDACLVSIEEKENKQRQLSTSISNIEGNIKKVGKALTDFGNLKKNLGYMDTKTQGMLKGIGLLKEVDEMGHDMFEDLIPLNRDMLQLSKSISDNIHGFKEMNSELNVTVKKVEIWGGHFVDSLRFTYLNGSKKQFGGSGGGLKAQYVLKTGEFIIKVEGTNIANCYMGGRIKITTNLGNVLEFEGEKSKEKRGQVYCFKSAPGVIRIRTVQTNGRAFKVVGVSEDF